MKLAASPRVTLGGPAYAGAALLLVCLIFGGGGVEGPAHSAVIEAVAVVIFFLMAGWALATNNPKGVRQPIALVLALLFLLALQLVPLPPPIWQALPGRETATEALSLIGLEYSWRPVSLDPQATLRSLFALSVPLAAFTGLQAARISTVRLCLAILVAAALLSTTVGILQIALDYPGYLTWFDAPSPGAGAGIFANPNHHATFLSIAIIGAAVLGATHTARPATKNLLVVAIAFLALGVVSTGARAGIALLFIVIPACALLSWRAKGILRPLAALSVFGLAFFLVVALYPETNRLALRESFSFADDGRAMFLPDLNYVARLFWPIGSGLGTFAQVFAANEDLDRLGAGFVNHAHNELYEWVIECGLLGLIVLGLALFAIVVAWKRRLRDPAPLYAVGGALMLLVLLVHSLFDYPLRTDAIAACAGIALALATTNFADRDDLNVRARSLTSVRRIAFAFALALGIGAGIWSFTILLSQWADRTGRPALALELNPKNASALARQSTRFLTADPVAARGLAERAVEGAPMLQRSVSSLASTRVGVRADAAWTVSAKLGWRDLETQWWAMRQAALRNEDRIAAERADALLRSARTNESFASLVRSLLAKPAFRYEFAKRLAFDPPWRRSLFDLPTGAPRSERDALLLFAQELRGSGLLEREDLQELVAYSITAKRFEEAWQVDRLGTGAEENSHLVGDPEFSREAASYHRPPGFGWWIRSSGSSSGSVESGVLIADTDGEARAPIAQQIVRLPHSPLELSARVSAPPQSDEAFALTLKCLDPAVPIISTVLAQRDSRELRLPFTPDGSCEFATLLLEALPGGRPDHVEVEKIDLVFAN